MNEGSTRPPSNVERAAETKRRLRDRKVRNALLRVLYRRGGAGADAPRWEEGELERKVRELSKLPRETWRRAGFKGEPTLRARLQLRELAAVVLDEKRFPAELLPDSSVLPACPGPGPERDNELPPHHVLVALAVNEVPDDRLIEALLGPLVTSARQSATVTGVLRVDSVRRRARLLSLAAEVLTRTSDYVMTSAARGDLKSIVDELHRLSEGSPGLAAREGYHRCSGLLKGLTASGEVALPNLTPADLSVWLEGCVETLVIRNEHRWARQLVERAGMPSDLSVLTPGEFLLERLVLKSFEGDAYDSKRLEAEREAEALERALPLREGYQGLLDRRTRAVRRYARREYEEALTLAVAPPRYPVSAELEREYGLPILAAIAFWAARQEQSRDQDYMARYLASLVSSGCGPFLEPALRKIAAEEVRSRGQGSDDIVRTVEALVPKVREDDLRDVLREFDLAWAFSPWRPHLDGDRAATLERQRASFADLAAVVDSRAELLQAVAQKLRTWSG